MLTGVSLSDHCYQEGEIRINWETDWLEGRNRLTPAAKAVIDAETGRRWTYYAQLNERACGLAGTFKQLGVKHGDRVALLAPNHISYLDILFACGKAEKSGLFSSP